MREHIRLLLTQATLQIAAQESRTIELPEFVVEPCRDRQHGDWASNIAMVSARIFARPPRQLAEQILQALPTDGAIASASLAGPGFINFRLKQDGGRRILSAILANPHYGNSTFGNGQRIQVEFVSANPTSALHVGHGRGAAYGMTVANLLTSQGYEVQREYYVNDAGRQMNILATSTFLRYLQSCGAELTFPRNGYRGDYISDIANRIRLERGDQFLCPVADLYAQVPEDEVTDEQGSIIHGDKEAHIDGLIDASRRLLGEESYQVFFRAALDSILGDIRSDLAEFGVHYDCWYSERSLVDGGALPRALDRLRAAGATYEDNGALWFRSTQYGDDKDRVLVRDNGQTTYFASDVAYHLDKFERGFDRVLNIWGADHHGYISRVRAALEALGIDPARLEVRLVQFVTLWRGEEQIQMSSRSGQFITLRALREEVGNDAARFYYILRKSEQHIDFDLQLATSQSKDNPVYYIQYAHARICSVLRNFQDRDGQLNSDLADWSALNGTQEQEILQHLEQFPELTRKAAEEREPHLLAHGLKDLAAEFHAWYNQTKVLVDEIPVAQARLLLCRCTAQVLSRGLELLGVSAPDHM